MPFVAKNKSYEIHIDGLTSTGQGIGRIDGFAVFVPFALPGENVIVRVVKLQKNYAFGKLEDIRESSPEREEALCPVFGRCGGCTLQHLSYSGQKREKRQFVVDALTRIGHVSNAEEVTHPIIGMAVPWRYRNKLSLPIGYSGSGVPSMGFYAARSHRIVETTDCPLQSQSVGNVRRAVMEYMEKTGTAPYDEVQKTGSFRHIYSRNNQSGESMIVAVSYGDLLKQDTFKESILSNIDKVVSLQINRNRTQGNAVLSGDFTTVYGGNSLHMTSQGFDYAVSASAFWQVNSEQMELLYSAALDMVDWQGDEFVVDAYCGVGSISLPLAKRAKRVLGIEIVADAIENAKENARRNGISNLEFRCGMVEGILPEICNSVDGPDIIFLDPPRKGCDKEVLQAIVNSRIGKLIYVSCDPATQARDAKILLEGGYELMVAQPVDMFPQTSHVENICVFQLEQ